MEWSNFEEWLLYTIKTELTPMIEFDVQGETLQSFEEHITDDVVLVFDITAFIEKEYEPGTYTLNHGGTGGTWEYRATHFTERNLEIYFGEEMVEPEIYPTVYNKVAKIILDRMI